jgi:zinc D-Ala-D-Ala dipeptidase
MVRLLLIVTLLAPASFAQIAEVYRIQPQRPVVELRREALRLQPPPEQGDFRPSELVDLAALDPTIRLDIKYATRDNFLSTPVYTQARALLQQPAAEAAVRAHRRLRKQGYGLVVHDAYRPWFVTWIFWEATPADKREFVADPARGSRHNRGCAIDVTLYELNSGRVIEMPSLYDEMTARAYPAYSGGPAEARRLRDLLRSVMEAEGFTVYESEWWHFDYKDWRQYRIANVPFEQIR